MALGHNRRFLPATLEMKRLLAEGALGTVLHAEGHISGPAAFTWKEGMWRADRSESPLGGMGAMGIHMIDMLINLMGPFAEVTVKSLRRVSPHVDDTTAMLARFASGATCTFATLSLAPQTWRVALYGTRGSLEMRGPQQLVFTPVPGPEAPEGWTREFPKRDIEAAELQAFAAAVAGGPAFPLPAEEAIHGVAVFEAMIGAAASGSTYAVA
jgi:predicted dehydrogenase